MCVLGLPVQTIHITVDVPGRGGGEEQVAPKQLRHLVQREAVQTVQTVLGRLLLPEPHEHVPLLLAKGAAHGDHLPELGEVSADLLLRDLAVLVEEGEAEVTKNVHLNVAVKLDEAVLAGVCLAHGRAVDSHDGRGRAGHVVDGPLHVGGWVVWWSLHGGWTRVPVTVGTQRCLAAARSIPHILLF